MKKAISLAAVIILCLSVLTSCGKGNNGGYPLTVNSTGIPGEIFSYYLDSTWNSPEAGNRDNRITLATNMCIRYVAVNSTFASYGLQLTPAETAEIAERANVLWNMFGEHYERIGISKTSYIKILTSEQYQEKLRLYFFDKGGTDEISEDVLRRAFYDDYVAFRYVRTELKNTDVYGNITDFTEEDRNKLMNIYQENVKNVSQYNGTEVAYSNILKEFPASEQSFENEIIDRNDIEYSPEFFDTVKDMKENTAEVRMYNNYIYIIYRVNVLSDPSVYEKNRSDCLKKVSENPLQSKITVMCNAFNSKRDSSLVNEYYNDVEKAKRAENTK